MGDCFSSSATAQATILAEEAPETAQAEEKCREGKEH